MTPSIEFLAEKLNGKLWVKGDLKRIYLDEGHNTKKMSTKTYAYQHEDGSFGVSCHIDCPSQAWQWVKSQEDEIKTRVAQDIEHVIAIAQLTLVEVKVLEEKPGVMVCVRKNDGVPSWYTEEIFYEEFGKYPEDVFDGVPSIQPAPAIAHPPAPTTPAAPAAPAPTTDTEFALGGRVKHPRFGVGTVVAERDAVIEINFNGETKRMLKDYVKLEILSDAN